MVISKLSAKMWVCLCPQPIFKDAKKQFVIMSLVEGKSLNQSHSGAFISSFCNFFNFINSEENRNLGRDLNVASEGAFDASSHIAISEQKFIELKKCLHVKSASMLYEVEDIVAKIEMKMNEFLLLKETSKNKEKFYQKYKCISPSDFGFHNSIIDTKGNINFVDFEYSGWDDPAKLVLDFLLHPAMTNSLADLRFLMSKIEIPRLNSQHLRARCDMVYKSAVLRWTVTLLNIFTHEYQNKKLFIDKNLDISKQQIIQLQKSKEMLTRIDGNPFIA